MVKPKHRQRSHCDDVYHALLTSRLLPMSLFRPPRVACCCRSSLGNGKALVDKFLDHLRSMEKAWNGQHPEIGVGKFIRDLTRRNGAGVDLYRGIVLTARILDLVHAPPGTPAKYLVSAVTVAVWLCFLLCAGSFGWVGSVSALNTTDWSTVVGRFVLLILCDVNRRGGKQMCCCFSCVLFSYSTSLRTSLVLSVVRELGLFTTARCPTRR